MLIDFGKPTTTTQGKLYRLTELEKETYRLRCSHFAPEVIEGKVDSLFIAICMQ